jgi:cob(I)alamin adenosyltransferase
MRYTMQRKASELEGKDDIMVTLTRIYTRGGDKGQTSLGDGRRVPKHDLRVEAYGTVDEANAVVGLARQATKGHVDDVMLERIQQDLFDLGADLCVPEAEGESGGLRILASQVERLEQEIDAMNDSLSPLKSFILPGGSAAAAHLHHARTVVRRAERLVTALSEVERVNPQTVAYINRLSDHLFVLARRLNANGADDVLWKPGATR